MELLVEQIRHGEFLHVLFVNSFRDWFLNNIVTVRWIMVIYSMTSIPIGYQVLNNIVVSSTINPDFSLSLVVGVELMVTGFNCGFLAFFWGQLASVIHTPN